MFRNRQRIGTCKPDRRVRDYAPRVEAFEKKTLLSTAQLADLRPSVPGDYEGIGKTDLAVYRPTTGLWIIDLSTGGKLVTQFGDPSRGDVAAPGDYDGTGKTDLAVFRPSTGQWFLQHANGIRTVEQVAGFVAGDLPVPGDYEGIGKTDLALYRPSTGQWFIQLSSGSVVVETFGDATQGDIPVPGDYEGTGKLDLAVFRPSADAWLIHMSDGSTVVSQFGDPTQGDVPVPGDYGGAGMTELAVFRPSTGDWFLRQPDGSTAVEQFGDPSRGDVPAGAAQTAVVAPVPYNRYMSNADWASLHQEFTAKALRGGSNVVFLGDSITYLWTAEGSTSLTSGFRRQFIAPRGTNAWNATFAPLGAVDHGIPGDLTGNLLWRVLNGEMNGRPKVAVVLVGLNDLNQGRTPIATADGVIAVANAVRETSPGTKLLLLGVLPRGAENSNSPSPASIAETNALVAQWSATHGATFEDFGGLLAGNVDDNGHPSEQGYQILATAIAGPLRALLAS